MLRSFIAESYAEQPVVLVAEDLKALLPTTSPEQRLAAALIPMLLPDLVDAVERVVVGANDSPQLRGFAGGLLTYVYNPMDLVQADGVVGWVDDAVVCAEGLHQLHERGAVELDEAAQALCTKARAPLGSMAPDLNAAIHQFLSGLWENAGAVSVPQPQTR